MLTLLAVLIAVCPNKCGLADNGYRIRGYCDIFSHILIKCFSHLANTMILYRYLKHILWFDFIIAVDKRKLSEKKHPNDLMG